MCLILCFDHESPSQTACLLLLFCYYSNSSNTGASKGIIGLRLDVDDRDGGRAAGRHDIHARDGGKAVVEALDVLGLIVDVRASRREAIYSYLLCCSFIAKLVINKPFFRLLLHFLW